MLQTRSGRRASQNEWELREFIALLQSDGVESYLEIGARHGDTFHEIMLSLPQGSRGVAVDLPGGKWGHRSSQAHLTSACADLVARGYRVDIVLGDSRARTVVEAVRDKAPYDAVLIDGDHLYDGVAADWRSYGPMARLVALHDIAGDGETTKDGRGLPVEVPRLWREIAPTRRHIGLIGPGSTMGIGVIWR